MILAMREAPGRLGFSSKSLWRILPKWEKIAGAIVCSCANTLSAPRKAQRRGAAMRALTLTAIAALLFYDAECLAQSSSAERVEQSIAANCKRWEELARKAARPDAEMTARHDLLMAKAAQYMREAEAHYHDVPLRQSLIEKEAQAEIEAKAIYDWQSNLKVATDCWESLRLTEEIHREQRRRLSNLARELADQQIKPPSLPEQAPYPVSSPARSPQPAEPTHVLTWGETPCGPMIPPAMRDQPVTNVNPMIPPGCR